MISTVVEGADFSPDEVMAILDEASQVIEYSRQLEQKSRALEVASEELRRVNRRLTELDRLKDEFVSTVSHELRTPLTSIRSFSEILLDNPDARRRAAQPVPRDRGQGVRAPDPADQRHPRHVADRIRHDGLAALDLRSEGRSSRTRWPRPAACSARSRSRSSRCWRRSLPPVTGRSRPADAGRDQPALQRRRVRPRPATAGSRLRLAAKDRRADRQRRGQRPRHPARAARGGVREVPSARRRHDDRQAARAPASASPSAARSSSTSAAASGSSRAEPHGAIFRFTLPTAPAAAGED